MGDDGVGSAGGRDAFGSAVGVALVGALGFVAVALVVFAAGPPGLDAELLRWFASFRTPWLNTVAVLATDLGSAPAIVALGLFGLALLWAAGRRQSAYLLAVAILGEQAVELLLKAIFHRPRPHVVPHLITVTTSSFPSGHAMTSATAYLTLAYLIGRGAGPAQRRAAWCEAGAVVLLVGLSRVYLGVHDPTDVLAGWLAGVAWMAATVAAFARWGSLEGEAGAPGTG